MTQTPLAAAILEKADAVKKEQGCQTLWASHVAAAAAEFCTAAYTGLDFGNFCYPRFEEERLRYAFAKEVKLSAYFRLRLSLNGKRGVVEEPFDLSCAEQLAARRNSQMLSADLLFLCALTKLHESYRPAVHTVDSEDAALSLLQEMDGHIYDYVIEKIGNVCRVLQKKSEEAAALRDWKPAAKFAEPEELAAMFFGKIQKQLSGNVLTLRFPGFFGTTQLKLSIHQADGIYYVHDNGCAIRHLAQQAADPQQLERIVKKVCHPGWIQKGRIIGNFGNASQFLLYLQKVVLVAHGDLYYTKADRQLLCDAPDRAYVDIRQADSLEVGPLLEMLQKSITFAYDENRGLSYWLDMRYAPSAPHCTFLLETLAEGRIRISDGRKGSFEGDIFENFYYCFDDITPYSDYVGQIAHRFGAEFDGRDVWLTARTGSFFQAMAAFFRLAVVLSRFGYGINVPKPGKWRKK